jgi:hypothetical protein
MGEARLGQCLLGLLSCLVLLRPVESGLVALSPVLSRPVLSRFLCLTAP